MIVLITAIPIHEFAHAYVAELMGDSTAKYHNRVSLNPLDHIDPIGAVMLLLFGVGFARPVPVSTYSFKNKKLGTCLVSLAGPFSNAVLAWICMIFYKLIYVLYYVSGFSILTGSLKVLSIMVTTNISLAVFNMIPIPPLDGYHAIMPFLPSKIAIKIQMYESYIVWGILALAWFGGLSGIISFAGTSLYQVIYKMTAFVDPLIKLVMR